MAIRWQCRNKALAVDLDCSGCFQVIRQNTVRSEILWEEMDVTSSVINLERTALTWCGHTEPRKEERLPKNILRRSPRDGWGGGEEDEEVNMHLSGKHVVSLLWKLKSEDGVRGTDYCRNGRREKGEGITPRRRKKGRIVYGKLNTVR
jgi:hypothetical protein